MKKFLLLFIFLGMISSKLYSQFDNFEYPDGDTLAWYWYSIAPLGVDYMKITSPGLTFPSYAGSGIGNAVKLDTATPDGVAQFFNIPGISNGSIYISSMVNVFNASAEGTYFTGISPHPFLSDAHCLVYIRDSSNKIAFGIAKKSEAPIYTPAQYFRNTTYLLISKYTFNPGLLNDSLSLFVYSAPPPSTEPAPTLGPKGGPDNDMDNAAVIDLFQGYYTTTLGVIVDGIYITNTWDNSILPVELASFTSTLNERDVTLNWSTVSEVNNSGFEIERSKVKGQPDGEAGQRSNDWSKIGTLSGSGTTNEPNSYSFTDRGLNSGNYNYRLKQIDFNGNFEYFNLSNEVTIGIPVKFSLSQNYPNPFNPSTKINYELPNPSYVTLKIYDMAGKGVAILVNEKKSAGYYTVDFNNSNLSSGVYFYKIDAGEFSATRRMILMK